MMGQTLTDTDYDRNHIKRKAKEYIDDDSTIDEAIEQISFHTKEQILAFADVVNIVAEYITLTNRLEAKANYFSKVFKKKYNSSPSNIKKLYSK